MKNPSTEDRSISDSSISHNAISDNAIRDNAIKDYEIEVEWGDQDAYQHVNNCEFARYAQESRIHFFYQHAKVDSGAVRPVMASLKLDFKRPVFYPDRLTISTHIAHVGTTSVTLKQDMRSQSQGTVVCEVTSVLVFVEFPAMKPAAVPDIFRAAALTP